MDLSVVVPIFNEEENIEGLVHEINESLEDINFEVIVVDDNSNDNSLQILKRIKRNNNRLRVIKHSKNYGQSYAVRSGIKYSRSEWIATLDGDGQNDPGDIAKLYEVLIKENANSKSTLIAGHRVKRKDSWLKRFSSKYANKLRSKVLKDQAPDTGCGLKLFSRDFFLDLPSFNHMHRYIPALFISRGGKVLSVGVNHRPRVKGSSKYGFNNRFWVGIKDILGVRWLQKRSKEIISKEV